MRPLRWNRSHQCGGVEALLGRDGLQKWHADEDRRFSGPAVPVLCPVPQDKERVNR